MSLHKFFDIDFETKSEVSIKKVGATAYAMHPSTEIMIIGYSFNTVDVFDYDPWYCDLSQLKHFIKKVCKLLSRGYKLRAFNSMFEFLIWNFVGVRQFGFPKLKITQTYCVQAECCAMGYPAKLENAAKVLNLIDQKDKGGTALINFFSTPSKAKGEHFKDPLQHKERFLQFKEYCQQDVVVQIAVSNRCLKLTIYQYATFIMTEKMNIRGLPIDVGMVEGALVLTERLKVISNSAIAEITKGKIQKVSQNIALKEWLNKQGCPIPNLQADTIERWLIKPKLKPLFKKVLKLRADGSKSSTAKYTKAMDMLTPKNKVHDFIKYHIAHTGRWGGRGLQIQNFSKPPKHFKSRYTNLEICALISIKAMIRLTWGCGSVSDALKAVTRGMVRAPEGYKFVSADYAQIEARVVMWLAGDETGMKDFAGGGLIYESMAASIFNKPVKSIKKPSFERDLGKETVLGCGFGMGWLKFLQTCVEKKGLDIKEKVAELAVKTYRKRYPQVQKTWKECERTALKALSEEGVMFSCCSGRITFFYEKGNLYLALPSGRKLCYPQANVVTSLDNWGNMKSTPHYYNWNQLVPGYKWVKQKIWGGILFQNAVQAIAADIMNEGMIKAESQGYLTRFTVHDEAVSLVRDLPKFNYPEYEKLLSEFLPKWSEGLHIIAEGWEGPIYRK